MMQDDPNSDLQNVFTQLYEALTRGDEVSFVGILTGLHEDEQYNVLTSSFKIKDNLGVRRETLLHPAIEMREKLFVTAMLNINEGAVMDALKVESSSGDTPMDILFSVLREKIDKKKKNELRKSSELDVLKYWLQLSTPDLQTETTEESLPKGLICEFNVFCQPHEHEKSERSRRVVDIDNLLEDLRRRDKLKLFYAFSTRISKIDPNNREKLDKTIGKAAEELGVSRDQMDALLAAEINLEPSLKYKKMI